MGQNKKSALLYTVLTVIMSGVAVAFQYILRDGYLEKNVGLYKSGAITPEVFYVYMIAVALFIVTVVFMLRHDGLPTGNSRSFFKRFFALVSSVFIIFSAVMFLMNNGNDIVMGSSAQMTYNFKKIASFLAFPAALYYMLTAFSTKENDKVQVASSFFSVLWTLLYLMSVYFDHSVLINSPAKVIQQLALVFLMVFQLFEIRGLIGRQKPIIYFMLSLAVVLFMSVAYIPELVDILTGVERLTAQNSVDLYCTSMVFYVLAGACDFVYLCPNVKHKKKSDKHKDNDKHDLFNPEEL